MSANISYRERLQAKLHILLKGCGIDKQVLYAQYGVASSTQMTDDQMRDLVARLEEQGAAIAQKRSKSRATNMSAVLAVLARLGYTENLVHSNAAERWRELNDFVRTKNKERKTLPEMDNDELRNLFVTLRAMECKGWRKPNSQPSKAPRVMLMMPQTTKVS